MPGITAALHPSWPVDATSIHHRSQRPSLPPLSPCTPSRRSTLDLQEYHHDARTKQQQQPGMSRLSTGFAWPTRRSSPPSTLATDRHLGAYPHLHSQDLDIPALWSPVQSPYASPVHSSPTSSNGTDGDWSDASTDFIQPHASTACKPSTYALNVSLGPADIAKTSAHTPYGRQPGYVSRAQLDQWEQQNARDGSGQIQAPAYSVDNLPKYRATEAVVRDDGHEEANRISNADFARRYVMPAGKTGDTSELIDRFARLQTKSSGYTPARGMPLPVTPAQDPVVIKASTNDALYARSFLPPTYSAATLLRDDQYDYYSYLLGQSPALPLVSAPSVDIPSAGAGALPPCKKKESLYKTELCRGYEERGHCDYGAKCQFAHGKRELRSIERHPKWKTERCRTYWRYGTCPYAKRCCFIHEASEGEMNASVSPPEATSKAPLLARVRAISAAEEPPQAVSTMPTTTTMALARSAPPFTARQLDALSLSKYQ